jgi:hypothetical protein
MPDLALSNQYEMITDIDMFYSRMVLSRMNKTHRRLLFYRHDYCCITS